MEANDLMIGDWVCVTKNFTQKYHQIRALSNDEEDVLKGTYINDYGVECNSIFSRSDIQPIPLTPEILEKNGFVYDSEDKLFEDIYPRISMLYAQYRLVENGGINYGEMSEIKYVHQLQHAFKLCGIDKEIEL